MGFMDKAKQLAEQAQQKLDEAQKNFSQSNPPESQPQGDAVKYDEHGRPVQEATPAGATAPPAAEPAAPAADAPAEPAPDEAPAPPKPAGDANTAPDPFKPIE
jgi:hypothetical protein